MARRDDAFGGAFSPPADALPAFFTSGSVDDKKYESLLEDLRAHDLLGPADADDTAPTAAALGGSSLFFNNAFSAAFLGNFGSSDAFGSSSNAKPSAPAATASSASKPPPGFARAPPGLAPSETDLKWARGQQAFSQLASASAASPYGKDDASDVLDANEIPSLKALGLDDDDVAATPVKKQQQQQQQHVAPPPGVPAPSAIPPPPGAWQQQLPPPPHHPQQYQHQHQHQAPPPPGMHHQQQQHQPPHHPYPHGPHGHGPPPPHMHPMHMGPPPPPFGMGGPPPPPHMGPPPHMHMQMRGPPPPPGPGGMPYPPPMMQAPPPAFAPRFKMMTPRDINFVVQAQTKWIRSSDPFSDDYYFHNYVQKRSRGPVPRPGARGLPLPSWKLEHIKSVDNVDSSRAAKSREWENQNHVLGRNNTRSLYRPKQSLNLAADATTDADSADPSDATTTAAESSEEPPKASSSSNAPMVAKTTTEVFGSDLWLKRQQIDRGLQCLLSLQDARHLLDARGINVQQFHSMDAQSMDPALAELRTRTTALLLELAGLLGVAAAASEGAPVACDVEQLHRVLSIAKGKRLLSRALPLLHPSARFVLLPHLIESLLSADAVRKIADALDDEDERLCQTLVLTLLYHPPAPSAELLTECLTRAMGGHDLASLRVLLYNRGRAEALQALLQRGGASVGEAASDATKLEWNRAQESFVALATAIKQTA